MKLFVGELASSIHRRVLLGEYVKEENRDILVKNLIQAREVMNSLNQLSWVLGDDPYFTTESICAVPIKHLVTIKICERETDLELISRYEKAVTEIKMRRSNLVKP